MLRVHLVAFFAMGVSVFLFQQNASAAPAVCSDGVMSKLRAPVSEQDKSIKINCQVSLKSTDVITKKVILEGAAASGVVFDCRGASIKGEGDMITVQSKKIVDDKGVESWQRPEDIVIRNCTLHGAIRIRGMAPNGEGEFLRASSRLDNKHTARAQAAAPRRILLEKLNIVGQGRIPLYVSPGSTYVTLKDSKISGKTSSVVIYLDAESANNVIQNNFFNAETESREVLAIDASAKNKIIGNRFSGLNHGGIYLYRNCGEGGTIRHQTPSNNQIINNVFFYKNYGGGNPSVWVASRNGNRGYCNDDSGFPWGSSTSNKDFARNNVIAENQIYVLDPSKMIRLDETPNSVIGNQKVSASVDRPSSCYLAEESRLLAHGKSATLSEGEGRQEVCTKMTCDDGLLGGRQVVACPEAKVVDFSCKVSGNNAGCTKSVACPAGYKIKEVKAACDLEMDSVSGALSALPWNTLKVERASDEAQDGSCSVNEVKISTGSAALTLRGLQSVRVQCAEHDKNGGDCEIKGQLRCAQ